MQLKNDRLDLTFYEILLIIYQEICKNQHCFCLKNYQMKKGNVDCICKVRCHDLTHLTKGGRFDPEAQPEIPIKHFVRCNLNHES